jgi:uncharacterized membrane protein
MTRRRQFIGAALLVVGVLISPWSVGLLATEDAAIDDVASFTLLLFASTVLALAGLHLLTRWIDRVVWTRPAGVAAAGLVLLLAGTAVAGTYWRVASYNMAHSHTTLVEGGHHETTVEEQQWAEDFYRRSLDAALKNGWFDFDRARAQGFEVDPINRNHYPNQEFMFDDVILDPERPEWLVYDDSPDGKVLMALMFFTRTLEEVGPTPGGPLAQWHYHPYEEVRCAVKGLWTIAKADANGQCAEGVPVTRTPEMLHVWFADHPLGRFTEMSLIPDYRLDDRFDPARLHPMAVHFAIALFAIAIVLDFVALVSRNERFHWAAWVNLGLAAVATIAAVFAGVTAELSLRPTHATHATLDLHKLFGFSALGIVLVLTGWRYVLRGHYPARAAVLYAALSLSGLIAIGGTGYYGGELVYDHGAGVRALDTFARERYWRQIREVYQPRTTPVRDEHSGHH